MQQTNAYMSIADGSGGSRRPRVNGKMPWEGSQALIWDVSVKREEMRAGGCCPPTSASGSEPGETPSVMHVPVSEAREDVGGQLRGISLRAEMFGGPSFTTAGELPTGHCSSASCARPRLPWTDRPTSLL